MPRPHNVSSVKRFLGMVGYFRDYVQNMSTRGKHLRSLLRKGTPFLWTSAHEAEFNDLKDALTSPDTMLFHPDWTAPFEVHTDASKHRCGAMLAQWHQNQLRPVKFSSRSFNPTESRWPTTHQELYAVKWALEQNRPYLLGRKIKVVTDHANLKWLTSISPQQSKLARWCISMAEFDFTLEHRPGKEHVVPDTLSRAPLPEPSTIGDNLVIFPAPVAAFFVTTFGFDIPFLNPSLVCDIFNDTLQCITLSCSLPSLIVTTRSKSKPSPPYPPPEDLPPTPPPSQTDTPPPVVPNWSADLDPLQPLNLSRANFAQKQRTDPWLGPLFQYLVSNQDSAILMKFPKKVSCWVKTVATNCKVIDGVIMYADKLMDNPGHYRIFVPSNPQLQRHFLHAYHDSPMGMHRGRGATYNALSKDFYWRNLSKHVRNWVRRCQHCIRFKSLQPAHGPMQIRLYQHPFHTLGVDYVGELPVSPNGNKWILTAVCPFSNYLRAIPVPDKTATIAANALFNDIFLLLGFPSVLQSDRGGELMNALLHRITQLLSIQHVFTSGFRPRLNGATERTHRFLNASLGIYCEHQQEKWEEYLQPAVYAHNTSLLVHLILHPSF